jgi:integrative and conjugative element protein (TIGR02256 family)
VGFNSAAPARMRDMFHQLNMIPSRATVRESAVNVIVQEVSAGNAGMETGGILLGRLASGGYLVSFAGGPGPDAIHKRDFFLRDLSHAQSLATDAWNADGSQWIGDWHTHPQGPLMPSAADLRSYRQHLKDPELGFTSFLSVVVRSTTQGVALAAWAVTASDLQRIELIAKANRD